MHNAKRKMKLQSDYQCWCLWDMTEPDNVDPDTLPISNILKARLHLWEETFDKTLDLADHSNIGFNDEQEYHLFYEEGWELLNLLRMELPDIEWWYCDRRYVELLREKPSSV
ncbi:hypothetical protein [Thalassospira lucentensis]|uniref:hypothetical protein n=1 Tax=Thalassospira lucentensis TaxID=168935 RepID=UPI00142D90AF|nr:hypothetical protein [Thalassospira lucentensis]NIZ03548.1 hypothetical protein [Thalassospira lucentensis]